MTFKFHPDMTSPTEPNSIFVFGSNLAGRHGAGSARFAFEKFGAEMGIGVGLTGQSWALPTVDADINPLPLAIIELYVKQLIHYASWKRGTTFFMTRTGCGIAGFTDEQIASLFKCAVQFGVDNFDYPEEWRTVLEAS